MKVTIKKGVYKSGTLYWLVRVTGPDGELLERRFFQNFESAKIHAGKRENESPASLAIPEQLKFEAAECAELLTPHGWRLRRATDYVLKNVIPYQQKPPIGTAVDQYLAYQEGRSLAPATMWDKRHRILMFKTRFGKEHLHSQTIETYSTWQDELAQKYNARTVCHFLKAASAFIEWAIPRGYCASNPIRALDWPKVKAKRPVIFTLEQAKRLFQIAPRHGLLAWAVLGTLDGIRPSEIFLLERLSGFFNRKERLIKIDGDQFTSTERRVIEFKDDWGQANLAWLKRCNCNCPIVPYPGRKHIEALRAEVGFWSHDIMRHTAASAHYARFSDIGETMKMLGHSGKSDVFHQFYKAVMTKDEAKRLYALRPS